MKTILLKWAVNAMALFVVVNVVSGISVDRWQTLLVGALVLGLLNAFLRPVLLFLTLPVNLLTLGLFTLVLNGLRDMHGGELYVPKIPSMRVKDL